MELNPETFSMKDQIFPVWEWSHALEAIVYNKQWRYRDFALANTERQYRHKCNLIENLSLDGAFRSYVETYVSLD